MPSTRALNGDATVFETGCLTRDGAVVLLRTSLPPSFPADPPELTLSTSVTHPWVDPHSRRVVFDGARPWRSTSSLSALISDVRQSLAAGATLPDPPRPRGGSSAAPVPAQPQQQQPQQQQQQQHDRSRSAAGAADALASLRVSGDPAVRDVMAALHAAPSAQLARLLCDDASFAALLAASAEGAEPAQLAAALRAGNAEAAAESLSLAEEASLVRSGTTLLRATDFADARRKYDELAARASALRRRASPEELSAQLGRLAASDEAEGAALEAKLMGGEVTPEAFVKAFRAARARFHARDDKRRGLAAVSGVY